MASSRGGTTAERGSLLLLLLLSQLLPSKHIWQHAPVLQLTWRSLVN
jgi:hypothetical protein